MFSGVYETEPVDFLDQLDSEPSAWQYGKNE